MEVLLEVLFAITTGTLGVDRRKKIKPIAIAFSLLGIFFITFVACDKYL